MTDNDYIPCPFCRTRPMCWVTVDRGVRVLRCFTCGHTQSVPYVRAARKDER